MSNKYMKEYERDVEKFEATERNVQKGLAAAMKKAGDQASKEFINAGREGSGENLQAEIQRVQEGGHGMREDNWGSEVTGFEPELQHLYNRIGADEDF